MTNEQEKVIVAYIPVIHEGYRQFFANHPEAKILYIYGEDLTGEFRHLQKDIRRLNPNLIKKSLEAWERFDKIEILNDKNIKRLQSEKTPLILSDDDLSETLAQQFFIHNPIEKDTIFLRWDKKKSIETKPVSPDTKISEREFDKTMMVLAEMQGKKAKDWWRRIGAIAVKDEKIILSANNTYVPSDQIANDEGDPRSNFKAGQHFESSLALHAEASIVAQAAKQGISLKSTDIYCDTFPCPPCAKQLAFAGIRRLFYKKGYAILDGERILKSQGVEIVFISPSSDNPSADQT